MQPTPREAELLEIIRQKDEEIARLKTENELLRQKVDLILRKLFGAKSEKLNPEQLLFLLQGEEQGKDSAPEVAEAEIGRSEKASPKPRKDRDTRWPENLTVVETILDPEPVKAAPEEWRFIGEEISEQLDYEPAQFIRRRLIRRKYVQRLDLDAVPIIAPLPPMLQERCTVVLFDWQTSRASTCLDDIIDVDFAGIVQSDGYGAYPAFVKKRKGLIKQAGCMAHVRRKFHEAIAEAARTASWFHRQIQHLYRVESSLRERGAGPRLRAAERAWKSAPVQERIYQALIRSPTFGMCLPVCPP